MAQFARPITDTTRTGWTEDDDTTVDIFDQIDESSADDADYIRTGLTPANAIYVAKLSAVTDPVSSTGHILRYHYRKDADGGEQINYTIQLRQGYVSEGSPGTLIAENVHTDIAGTGWVTVNLTLSGGQADAITNYADLYTRSVGNKP